MPESTVIETGAPVATLINVFTVRPERQRELADCLAAATDEVMRHVPGFVSANIHISGDGERVVNYAQWESAESFQRMLQDPVAKEHMDRAAAIADGFEPHLYTVDSVHHR
ncbi:antibiotic biosynthesis monooxygenase [Streptomonospora halophila]|uniref:Antibiotic biosynthesis monooxygenase n=1 Tax=Streptomonospora halophila TaxID=427369 RepID=A0ABP9GUD3_9ACTN